jgi:pyruvate dehydrogenase E2 component (dihydrolipoamide acetyltransferase)
MAVPVIMPRQGQSVESCIFSEWFVKIGDKVKKGDLLFSYETDKAAFEAESPEDGTLLATFAEPGDAIPVLQNIAVVGEPGEDFESLKPVEEVDGQVSGQHLAPVTETGGQNLPQAGVTEDQNIAGKIITKEDPSGTGVSDRDLAGQDTFPQDQAVSATIEVPTIDGELKISPRAKKTAEDLHINFSSIKGTGPEGRIIEKDILRKAQETPRATPLAKSISYEDHVDLPVSGTGPQGKVTAQDVKRSGASPKDMATSPAGIFEDKKISNIRRIIAENMHASLQNTAQLTLHSSADARKIKALRKAIKKKAEEGKSPNITINDLVCYAAVRALANHPEMNVHFLGDTIRYHRDVHLGFAVDTERGLMVPTLRNANHLTLDGFAIQMKELATLAQSGKIDPELLSGATFTVTNLGAFGIEMFTPVLNPPQIGILGVNTITLQPSQMDDGSFGFIPRIGLSLTFDHRAIDGAPAAAFLKDAALEIEKFEL